MSLLLDALKRAEQEKHVRPDTQDGEAAPATKAALALQPVARAPEAAAVRGVSQGAAQGLASPPVSRRRPALWVGGTLVVLAIVGVVAYVWYSIEQLQPKSIARVAAARPPSPQVAAPPPSAPASVPVPATRPAAATESNSRPARAANLDGSAARVPPPDSGPSGAALLQTTRSTDRPSVPADVAAGYEALRRGDLAAARRRYAAAYNADFANLDATLGLATVEARSGQREQAAAHYRRALEIDPRNATALAGLAALSDFARADALEQRIARDIARHPESAALRYMLGNLYAAQGHWSLAQAAYFEAHRLDPGSADILHNLAVSLDHIGQSPAAAGYYARALEAARAQPGTFDTAAVERRLAEIAPAR